MQMKKIFPWKKCVAIAVTASMMFCSASDMGLNLNQISDFVSPITVEAYSTGNYKVKTSGSNLNVRSGAGTGYRVVGKLANGSSFSVYQISGNWGKISSSSSQWVCLTYSTYLGSSNSDSTSNVPAPSGKTGSGQVYNCSALNVRDNPGTKNTNIITSIKCGTSVNIMKTSGNWGYDSLHSGWVSLTYITFSGGGGGSSQNYATLESRPYMLEPMCSGGKVIDVTGWGKSNCTNVQIWEKGNYQANQTFEPVSLGNGYYMLRDVNSGKVLDVCGGNAYDGANVIIHDYHGGANQQWRFIYKGKENGHNWYEIQSKVNSNYYLDVSGAGNYNGCNLQLYHGNGTNAQKFMLWYGKKPSNIINDFNDKIHELIYNNGNNGHSEFKPRQQRNYTQQWHSCGTTIAGSGCGILATINAVGYLTGKEIPVVEAAKYCGSKNLHSCGKGGKYDIPQEIVSKYGAEYGVKITKSFTSFLPRQTVKIITYSDGKYVSKNQDDFPRASTYDAMWSELISRLQKGEVAVTLVPHHYIAIVAYDKSTGKVLVYDSAAGNSRGTSTDGTWVSKDELNINSNVKSPGIYTELKIRQGIVYIGRK